MAGDYTHYEIQPRQRLTTDALNEQEDWLGRLTLELARRMVGGDTASVSGVLDGLVVTISPGTMNSIVNGGVAMMYDAVVAAPANPHRWIEVADGAPIVKTHDNGGAAARWDVIEIAPGVIDGPGDILDVYDPNLGAPVPTLLAPRKVCTPVVTVRKGTENVLPKLPSGIASRIPLAYVYVAAGVVALDATKVIYCRPILRPRVGWRAPLSRVRGGGFDLTANGASGTCPAGMNGYFSYSSAPFSIAPETVVALEATGNWEGGGIPLANTLVHFYAAPPPYPAGYDGNLAGRELQCSDPTLMWGGYKSGMTGCIVVGSATGPAINANGAPTGGGNITITAHNLWGTMALPKTQMLYLGAAFWDAAVAGMIAQRLRGTWVAPSRKTGATFQALLPIAAPTIFNMWSGFSGAAFTLPATARKLAMQIFARMAGGAHLLMELEDHWTGTGNTGQDGGGYFVMSNPDAGLQNESRLFESVVEADGTFNVQSASAVGIVNTGRFVARAYEDAVLALR